MLKGPCLLLLIAVVGLLALVSTPPASGQVWVEKQKLVASDGALGNAFGSVAIDGDTAIIGDIRNDENGHDARPGPWISGFGAAPRSTTSRWERT